MILYQRHALDLVYSHSPVPPIRLELRTAPREWVRALRTRGGLPNVAEPRHVPTSPGRTQSYGHFQVSYTLPFLGFPPFSPHSLTNTDSGDDHDYCEYIHTSQDRSISEVTIKSLSIAMGIRQPGFQLLSLSSERGTHAHQPCVLPDQVRIYSWVYAPLILATIVLVTARALTTAPSCYQKHNQRRSVDTLPYPTSLRHPRPVAPRGRSYYRSNIAVDLWAVTWPPLGVYMITAFMAFW
jgi:hypothetical protein